MAHALKLNTSCRKTDAPWDPEQVLVDALAERALFLKQKPCLKKMQGKIDRMLDRAGNAEARMTVLAIMMEANLVELMGRIKQLNSILLQATE